MGNGQYRYQVADRGINPASGQRAALKIACCDLSRTQLKFVKIAVTDIFSLISVSGRSRGYNFRRGTTLKFTEALVAWSLPFGASVLQGEPAFPFTTLTMLSASAARMLTMTLDSMIWA